MFISEIPEVIEPEKYDAKTENQGKQKDTVRGQIPEHKMFQALNEYFMDSKDDVLVIHSHKVIYQGVMTTKPLEYRDLEGCTLCLNMLPSQ